MNIFNQTNTLRLFKRIFDSHNSTETIIPYYPQKKEFFLDKSSVNEYRKNNFITPRLLTLFLREIESDKAISLHSLCISKNGETVFKLSTPYHKTNMLHAVHSASKSITSLAVGILISQGKLSLDDKLCDILPDIYNPITKFAHKGITVRNLLMMSTGVGFNETEVYSDEFYDKAYALSPLAFTPGTDFAYNSLNSYMLGRIVEKISGMKLCDFVDKNIFTPLGITNYYWEECPKGHTKGGWGLYLTCEDMLKIGELYLCGGKFADTQIVDEEWIKLATSKQISTPAEIGDFDYGYHIWVARDNTCYLINGMFGQNVFCFPESNICVAMTGGIDDFFQTSNIYKIVRKYFTSPTEEKIRLTDQIRFKNYLKYFEDTYHCLKCKTNTLDFNKSFASVLNRSYDIVSVNNKSVGIMPVVLQILQNNYTRGITRIAFKKQSKQCFIVLTENATDYCIPISDKSTVFTKLDFNKEIYNVASFADFAQNENGELVLKIRLDFNETGSTRFITVIFYGDTIRAKFTEAPELEFVMENMGFFLKNIGIKSIREALANGFESDISRYIYDNSLKPELKGKLI